MKNNPQVSIIISTRNEEDVIEVLLASVKKQTYKQIEIIVVDNNSSDKTKAAAKKFTNLVFNSGPERSAQRNYGAKKAKAEFLFFLDADMELTTGVIEECIKTIRADKQIGGVIVPEISVGKRFWEKVKAFERSFYFDEGGIDIESARFFKKEAYMETGGYDTEITGTEDWDLSEKVRKSGWKITRIKSPLYHHETIPSLGDLAKKYYYYGLTAPKTLANQKKPLISPKTIHFLRPAFYKKFYLFFLHPVLAIGVFLLLSTQISASGIGYITGKVSMPHR